MAEEILNRLSNVQLSDEEDDEIVISDEIIQDVVTSCRYSCLGKLLTTKRFNVQFLKDSLRRAWGSPKNLCIMEVGSNLFHFKFESEDQLTKVWNGGPWNFDNRLLVLQKWEPDLSPELVEFKSIEFWVQVWGLPFQFITPVIGESIGNKMGEFLGVDGRALAAERGKFIRIRVRLPLNRPIKRGSNIVLGQGNRCWVDYKYERLNSFCFYCGFLGHEELECMVQAEDTKAGSVKPFKYGESMKAGFGYRRGYLAGLPEVGKGGSEAAGYSRLGGTLDRRFSVDGDHGLVGLPEIKGTDKIGGGIVGIGGGSLGISKSNPPLIDVDDDARVSFNGKELKMRDLIESPQFLNSNAGGNLVPIEKTAKLGLPLDSGPSGVSPILIDRAHGTSGSKGNIENKDGPGGLLEVAVHEIFCFSAGQLGDPGLPTLPINLVQKKSKREAVSRETNAKENANKEEISDWNISETRLSSISHAKSDGPNRAIRKGKGASGGSSATAKNRRLHVKLKEDIPQSRGISPSLAGDLSIVGGKRKSADDIEQRSDSGKKIFPFATEKVEEASHNWPQSDQ